MSSGRAVDWLRTRRSTLLLVLFFASLAFNASRVTGPFDWRMPLALLIGVYPHSSPPCLCRRAARGGVDAGGEAEHSSTAGPSIGRWRQFLGPLRRSADD